MIISLKGNPRISLILIFCNLIFLIGCADQKDLLLISDPHFDQILFNTTVSDQFSDSASQAGRSFDSITYDVQNQTGTFLKSLKKSNPELIMLSPSLSVVYKLDQDEFLSAALDNLRDTGTKLVCWVSVEDVEQIESLSLTYGDIYIVIDPLEGWSDVDKLLIELYDDYHKVGVIYNRTAFGYSFEPEDLLPELFSDTSNHPELLDIEGASISDAKAKDSISQYAERGVELLCLFTGVDTPNILQQMNGKEFLAIVEHGEYLPTYHDHLYGSLSFDYKEICDQLFSTSKNSTDSVQFIRSTKGFFPY